MKSSAPGNERARTYHRWQFRLAVLSFLLGAAYLAAWLSTGAALRLREALTSLTPRPWLQLALALVILAGLHRLVTLPLAWLTGFWLPRRFGLLHQTLPRWLWDVGKAAAIGSILGLVGAELIYGLIRATAWWWLWGAALFLCGYAFLSLITPLWLVPLFYRLTPLGEGELRRRLLELADRVQVPALGVWIVDQSRKSRTANAAVVGLGATRRIILFDTLVTEFTADEIEAVLAHELAHDVHGDIWRGLLVQGALTVVTFWIADRALRAGGAALGFTGPDDLAGLPLFGLILMGIGVAALPLGNAWSRRVERQADDYALRVTGNLRAFVGAMERLAALNLAERDPHPLKEFLLYSHPSIGRRVARARASQASLPASG